MTEQDNIELKFSLPEQDKAILDYFYGFSAKGPYKYPLISELGLLRGEEYHKTQTSALADYIMVGDKDPQIQVDVVDIETLVGLDEIKFINNGELISGSSVAQKMVRKLYYSSLGPSANDIDIYFKSIDDAKTFCSINKIYDINFDAKNSVCAYAYYNKIKLNLIYGIEYSSPADLICRFDIRACSMAIDPNNKKLYLVRASVEDAYHKQITFNPVPRAVNVNRLVKYINKGFTIDPHQRVFFAELLQTDIYSQKQELITGY